MISALMGMLLLSASTVADAPVDTETAGQLPAAYECSFANDDEDNIPPDCVLVQKFGSACTIRCPDGLFLILCEGPG